MAMAVRLPRSFAGDKAASLEDFLQSTAHALLRGDPTKQESITRLCARIQQELSARVIIDVGGLMRLKRCKMLEILAGIDKDLEHWVEYIEDVLEFEFPTSTAILPFRDPAAPPSSAALVPPPSSYRIATYKTEKSTKAPALGAKLQLDGQLDQLIFVPSMFTKIRTQNPQEETLTEPEVEHINDTVWELTFQKYGEVHVDKIYRAHCGRQLRRLFPHLPDRGKTKGDDRTFEEMLKWRFQNAVKQQAPGKKAYKPNLAIDRINLCEAALELVEKRNFPLTLLDEGILDTKFIVKHGEEEKGDGEPYGEPMPRVSIFGDEPPPKAKLPPQDKTIGALAPVPASAANCAASTQLPGGSLSQVPKKRSSTEPGPEPAPKKKAKKVFGAPRTEPVRPPHRTSSSSCHSPLCVLSPLHRWRCSTSPTCLSRHCLSGRSRRTTRWWSAYPTRPTTASSLMRTGTAS